MKKSAVSGKKEFSKSTDKFVFWMLLGIPVLFIVAAPLHFLYDWTGKNPVIGLFTPVNESPWEHLKMTFWPIIVWWVIGSLAFNRQKGGAFPRTALSCAVCALACNLFIISFFYTYTGAFGCESLIVDILSLLLGLAVGVFLAIHIYRYSSPGPFAAFLSVSVLLLMSAAFICFTFNPPHIPLFFDTSTGTYGI